MDGLEQSVLDEELQYADAPVDGIGTTRMVGSCIREWGTAEQRATLCPAIAAGEVLISLGYTEPDAGSDVSSVRTRAEWHGDFWTIRGEKLFTTLAHVADYVFLLTRTNEEVPRRQGLTMFLVPTSAPGFSLSPIETLSGERTNATLYDDVRLPDSARIGEVDGGWRVLGTALEIEHAAGFGAALARALDHAVPLIDPHDPATGAELARIAADAEVARLLQREAASQGTADPAIGPMAKLFSSEAFCRDTAILLDLLGATALESVVEGEAAGGPALVELAYRHSHVTRIYAGTSEIQRSIIAERGLGLPRSRRL
jgi:alkylation response protein AidB-like acyl-CoA dehydrogenase